MTETCDSCGGTLTTVKTPQMVHYAKKECENCGKWDQWISNPHNQDTRTTTSNQTVEQVAQFHNQNEERCFFCRRKSEQLDKNQSLTLDHIHELDKGGEDEIENLQILCTACHKLKNHQRLYHNWHRYGEPSDQ